jgi:AcrR family transcriptional regulator
MSSAETKPHSRRREKREDPRVQRSREKIRAAFVDLLQTRELQDFNIHDVAAASDVGYSTFYRHYETKEQLVAEIARAEADALTKATLAALLSGPSHVACRVSARFICEHKNIWIALTAGSAAAILREQLLAVMLESGDRYHIPSGFLPSAITASICATIVVDLFTWWLRQAEHTDPDHLAQAIDRMIAQPYIKCWLEPQDVPAFAAAAAAALK